MFIHFTFGDLARRGLIKEQTESVIKFVLQEKRLQVSKCWEFIPKFPERGAKRIPEHMFKATDNGIAADIDIKDPDWFNKLPDAKTVHYLHVEVPMLCFIKVSFNKLKNSMHHQQYGKFGVVLTDEFLKRKKIKPVYYYTEESLWNDPLIRKWNYGVKSLSETNRKLLIKEIVSYRKPATLFPSFKESISIEVQQTSNGTKVKYLTYDRYDEGYDFEKENEYRIVFDEGLDYLYFNEDDLYMVITPNSEAKSKVESFFKQNWGRQPSVKLYPI